MRKIFCLILIFCLVGCSQPPQSFQERLENTLLNANQIEAVSPSNRKIFYSYYVEPSVGRIDSNESSNIFEKNNVKFVMNLNVSNIINTRYYSDAMIDSNTVTKDELLFTINGKYKDYLDNEYDYSCDVYKYDNTYYMTFVSKYMNFYAIGNQMDLITVAQEMLKISKTIRVDEDAVISHYSSKETVEYQKEALQLFEVVVPENGRVDEMLSNKTEIDNIDNNVDVGTGDEIYQSDDLNSRVPTPTPVITEGNIEEATEPSVE